MASGRLGTPADLSATTNTSIYTCGATNFAVVNVTICNRNSSSVQVRIALSTSGTPANADYLEYGVTIPANAALERTGIVMSPTNQLVVYSSTANVSAIAYGVES